jgi:hypothetical protein
MKLTTSNVVTGNISVSSLNIGNTLLSTEIQSLSIGNVAFTSNSVNVGNVSITPIAITTPELVVGGAFYTGGTWSGIVNYQEFTANGTWNNPYFTVGSNASLSGNEQVLVMAWGGGGGGRNSGTNWNAGGGGGACVVGIYTLSQLTSTISVTVGDAGTGGATATNGGNSIFGSLVAYGGSGASADSASGAGGGTVNAAATTTGGAPLGGAPSGTAGVAGGTSTFGGGGGVTVQGAAGGGISIFGGGGGSGNNTLGGNTVYGGGGGAGRTVSGSVSNSGGRSVFGGIGGNNTVAAATPGGGGAGFTNVNGARGEVRVWVMGPAGTTLGAPTYIMTANTTALYEQSSVLYTVTTTNVANGTTLYYTLNNSSTATSADFTTSVNGAFVVSSGTGTFTLTANNDADATSESFRMDIRTGSTTGTIVATNNSVSIIPVTIQYIGGAGGDSTVTIPAGAQDNDLLVAFTFRDGNATPPTLPAGWTNIGTGANSASVRLCYKLRAAGDTSVTFNNGTASIVHVYRGVNTASPIGGHAIQMNTSGVVSWPAFTMTNPGGSWLAAAGHTVSGSGNGQRQVLPAGSWAVRESDSDATDDIGSIDSNGPVSSWSGFSFESNSGNDAGGAIVEIKNSL